MSEFPGCLLPIGSAYLDLFGYRIQQTLKLCTDCRRKFRSQTSDNMDRLKSRGGKSQRSQRKEDAGARKGRKDAAHYVFPMVCGSGGSKSRLAKAAGAEPSGQMRNEKLHAVVARSTFPSQNAKSTT